MENGERKKKVIKRDNNIAKGRQGLLTPHMSVRVHLAYKPHTSNSGQSSKPNGWAFGLVQSVEHPKSKGS